jgi:hypothetical protein
VKRTFEALTTVVSVTVDDELPIVPLARMVLEAHPESTREPELELELRGGTPPKLVCVGHYETAVEDPFDLVAVLELDLYQAVAERASAGWLLHAAALERDGHAVVFAGASGAGKTTLTLALVSQGWRIATEEMVLVDRAMSVRGLARPIHTPSDGPQHRAIPPSWSQMTYPLRGASAKVLGVIAQPPPAIRITTPLPLAALIHIAHGPDLAAALEPLAPRRALEQLWPCSLRQDDDGLAAATAIVSVCRALALTSSSVEQAANLVNTLNL